MKIFLTHTVVVIMILAGTSPALSGALHMAAQEGHTEIVKALLAAGAEVNAKDKDGRTARNAGAEVTAKEDQGAWTALHWAVQGGHTETVKALLADGAAVNAKYDLLGWRALDLAAQSGYTEIVKALLASGAAVNAKDDGGWTALHLAALTGHPETVKALLAGGAAGNAKVVKTAGRPYTWPHSRATPKPSRLSWPPVRR